MFIFGEYNQMTASFLAHRVALEATFKANKGKARIGTITQGPAHGLTTTMKFGGAVAMGGDLVALAPLGIRDLFFYHGDTNTLEKGPRVTAASGEAFRGMVRGPDGRLFLMPCSETAMVAYDPANGSVTRFQEHGQTGSARFIGGAMAGDGIIVLAPYYSPNIGIYDTKTGLYTAGPAHGFTGEDPRPFSGAVTLADNETVVLICARGGRFATYNVRTKVYQLFGADIGAASSQRYIGGMASVDGRSAIAFPSSADAIGVATPDTRGVRQLFSDTSGAMFTPGTFRGGCYLPDGRILIVPNSADTLIVYDPETEEFSEIALGADGTDLYVGAVPLDNGKTLIVPGTATNFLLLDTVEGAVGIPNATWGSRYFSSGFC